MPVRSLSSSVLRWPDASTVDEAARSWARKVGQKREDVCRIGYFGSYARGDWGVGSDLDVIIILDDTLLSTKQRYAKYYPDPLPVPVDLWVYTASEWNDLSSKSPHLWQRLQQEMLDLSTASPSTPSG